MADATHPDLNTLLTQLGAAIAGQAVQGIAVQPGEVVEQTLMSLPVDLAPTMTARFAVQEGTPGAVPMEGLPFPVMDAWVVARAKVEAAAAVRAAMPDIIAAVRAAIKAGG